MYYISLLILLLSLSLLLLDVCPAAPYLQHSHVTDNTALVSWSAAVNADKFTVRYIGNQPGMGYQFKNTTSSTYQLQSLTGHTYVWDVKVFCDDNNIIRFYYFIDQFTTTGTLPKMIASANNDNKLDLYVFPNPSNGLFTVAVTGVTNTVKLSVFNIAGQLVYSKDYANSFTDELNLSGLAKGLYLLKIESGYTSDYKKLVIN